MKEIWLNSDGIKSKELTFAAILRSIWCKPLTSADDDFGEIKRITKEGSIKHSPFFYGPLNDQIYCDLVQGVGDHKTGVRLIRRVLDHMSHYNHVPSKEIVQILVEECVSGKWPRALYSSITYACNHNSVISHKTWMAVLNYYRFDFTYFAKVEEILDLALKNGAKPCFELIHLYVAKSYEIIDEIQSEVKVDHIALLDKIRAAIITLSQTPEERAEKISELMLKYIKFLISINEMKDANDAVLKHLEDENYSLESIEVCFKAYEEIKDSFKALRLYQKIINHPNFVYTPKIIVAILRMCSVLGEPAYDVIKDIEELIIKDSSICTPFAINTIIISYSVGEQWESIIDFLGKVFYFNLALNKYTGPTIRKMCENCPNQVLKSKLFEQAAKADQQINKA